MSIPLPSDNNIYYVIMIINLSLNYHERRSKSRLLKVVSGKTTQLLLTLFRS
jgi:hypothetical protein